MAGCLFSQGRCAPDFAPENTTTGGCALARGGEECFRMSSTQSTQSGRNAAIVRNCQAPHLFTKVTAPDSKALPPQCSQRYLAGFIAGFGILIIGGKEEKFPLTINATGRLGAAFSIGLTETNMEGKPGAHDTSKLSLAPTPLPFPVPNSTPFQPLATVKNTRFRTLSSSTTCHSPAPGGRGIVLRCARSARLPGRPVPTVPDAIIWPLMRMNASFMCVSQLTCFHTHSMS
jgi:hypothetical protein